MGLAPSHLALSPNESTLAVANSHSDSVSLLDAKTLARTDVKIPSYPDAALGSQPVALAFAPDGKTLYVACGGNNAIAVLTAAGKGWKVAGAIPTGWFPSAIALDGEGGLRVLNIKGVGNTDNDKGAFNSQAVRRLAAAHSGAERGAGGGGHARGAGGQQPGVRTRRRRRQPGVARHPARVLHHQGEPHLRPGVRRHGQGQRRPQAVHVRPRRHAQPPRAGREVRAARQFPHRRRHQLRRPPVADAGLRQRLRGARLRRLAARLRLEHERFAGGAAHRLLLAGRASAR